MEVIVLAGGFGTRLKHIVPDLPKSMAPIEERPFLQYVLDWLVQNRVTRVILAVGYMHEKISSYFGSAYGDMELMYSVEDTPLFTGGAIKKALTLCREPRVFAVNGDTFFTVNLQEMERSFEKSDCFMIAVKKMKNFSRYGSLKIENGRIIAFREKAACKRGIISGGVYLIRRDVLEECPERFSIEADFLEKRTQSMVIKAFLSDGYFIDIGVPEDYQLARKEIKSWKVSGSENKFGAC